MNLKWGRSFFLFDIPFVGVTVHYMKFNKGVVKYMWRKPVYYYQPTLDARRKDHKIVGSHKAIVFFLGHARLNITWARGS